MKKGFSLIELLVGILIGLILIGMMAVFMGDVSYVFQDQKMMVKDRGQLQRNMLIMSRELMEAGYRTQEKNDRPGQIERVDELGNTVYDWFLEADRDADGFPVVVFWSSPNDMDLLASQDETLDVAWNQTTYQVGQLNHPVTGEPINALLKNGVPFIFGVTDFTFELGLDPDENGLVEDLDWIEEYPESEDEKLATYPMLKKIRMRITSATKQASKKNDDPNVYNSITQEIYLRNRRDT